MNLKTPLIVISIAVATLAAVLLIACGDGDNSGTTDPTAAPPDQSATPTPDFTVEQGNDPIFYRTTDGFQTLTAGEPYKVLLRITNGYAAESLRVRAERPTDGLTVEFEPLRSQPVGDDNEPGSYYPLALDIPEPGSWQLYVMAGAEEGIIFVTVAAAEN